MHSRGGCCIRGCVLRSLGGLGSLMRWQHVQHESVAAFRIYNRVSAAAHTRTQRHEAAAYEMTWSKTPKLHTRRRAATGESRKNASTQLLNQNR